MYEISISNHVKNHHQTASQPGACNSPGEYLHITSHRFPEHVDNNMESVLFVSSLGWVQGVFRNPFSGDDSFLECVAHRLTWGSWMVEGQVANPDTM